MIRARVALTGIALVVACGGEPVPTEDPGPRSGPPCPTSLEELSSQVFQVSCVDAGCHGSNDRAGGLDLQASALEAELFGAAAALCDGEVRVVPGDAMSSYLVDKLRGTGCGAPMPILQPLPTETIDCIEAWIDGLEPLDACETCGAGQLCIDLGTDPAHCGTCGNACPATSSCIDGTCSCPGSQSICNESCVDLTSDRANCGTSVADLMPGSRTGSVARIDLATAGAETAGDLVTDADLVGRVRLQQGLGIGVDSDELDAHQLGPDHAVDGVAATPADSDDPDEGEVL